MIPRITSIRFGFWYHSYDTRITPHFVLTYLRSAPVGAKRTSTGCSAPYKHSKYTLIGLLSHVCSGPKVMLFHASMKSKTF